ncbi:MAG: plastocyanin/azurin family copper-binding protein [Gemmatimonadales bacterium]|jgi:plastocyanin
MRVRFLPLVVAATLAAAACGGSSSSATSPGNGVPTGGGNNPPPAPTQTNQVAIGDDFFSPTDIQVPVGTTVTWTWSASQTLHNVTFADASTSGNKNAGATFTKTFASAGKFSYICTLHNMLGSVLVQ